MFTGIISDVGRVVAAEERGDLRLRIACAAETAAAELGASIACSGVCLTVVDKGEDWFAVDVSAETLRRTAPELWREGARVNLERSLRLGDELGGHIVTGHVDAVGEIEGAAEVGGSLRVAVLAPQALEGYVAPKGSIALDGVSLTVNEVEPVSEGVRFTVNVIPHTAERTTLADLVSGRKLNIEIDVLARYIGRMLELRR
jgi:riboflavin synthase